MSQRILFTAAWITFSSLVGAAELPKLQIVHPIAMDRYSPFSNMAILGKVDPQLDTTIQIRLYQVRDDGKLFLLVGTTTKLNEHGMFVVDVEPSGKGWPTGKVRVEARVNELSQLREFRTVEIVESQGTPPEGYLVKEVIDSGIVVDTAQPNGPYEVIGGQTFLVRGRFQKKDGRRGNQGPRASVEIVLPANPGKNPEITYQSASAISLPEVVPDQFWYEIAIVAPEKSQKYKLRVKCNAVEGKPIVPEKQPQDGFDLNVGP